MIKFTNVTKEYSRATALDDINLEINENKIYCLLGRNGAGKTTFLKLIAGHINATKGYVTVDGGKVSTFAMPEGVSFIESRASQFNMRIGKLLDLAYSLQPDMDIEFAKDMLRKFKLDKNKKYKQLSFGMQTMFTTLLGLASRAKVVILDEPVLGFDAIMRERFYELLQSSFEYNPRIIIVSTHLIDEISRVAEDIVIIDEGSILLHSSMNDIDEKAYSLTGASSDVKNAVKGLNVIGEKTLGGFTTAYIFGDRIIPAGNVKLQALGLQEFFVNIVGGGQEND
ncbi:MAG: transporter family protein [Eubacterium sp.]|nr:transporter family protein [Eubacterium sp.]